MLESPPKSVTSKMKKPKQARVSAHTRACRQENSHATQQSRDRASKGSDRGRERERERASNKRKHSRHLSRCGRRANSKRAAKKSQHPRGSG